MKIYEYVKKNKSDFSPLELVEFLKKYGFNVKRHTDTMTKKMVEFVKEAYKVDKYIKKQLRELDMDYKEIIPILCNNDIYLTETKQLRLPKKQENFNQIKKILKKMPKLKQTNNEVINLDEIYKDLKDAMDYVFQTHGAIAFKKFGRDYKKDLIDSFPFYKFKSKVFQMKDSELIKVIEFLLSYKTKDKKKYGKWVAAILLSFPRNTKFNTTDKIATKTKVKPYVHVERKK